MSDYYMHFKNTGARGPVHVVVWHRIVISDQKFYETSCDANGGTGVPYKPRYQSYHYNISLSAPSGRGDKNSLWRSRDQKGWPHKFYTVENGDITIEFSYDGQNWSVTPGNAD
jgi:hypothetical protein